MIHIILHFVLPLIISFGFYYRNWKQTALILISTMLVDLDHLFATPMYDPERCSIGFHPLHTELMIFVYAAMFILPITLSRFSKRTFTEKQKNILRFIHLVGLGLLIHMGLDWTECW